jgi:hypothetical protein
LLAAKVCTRVTALQHDCYIRNWQMRAKQKDWWRQWVYKFT